MGPGSSRADYALAGVDFEERWPRFDQAVRSLRGHLGRDDDGTTQVLEPRPTRPGGPPIWIGSWGSDAGLRRVARLGDGWLASAYNTTPEQVTTGREKLAAALATYDRAGERLDCVLATMWTHVTDDAREREDTASPGWRRCSTDQRRSSPGGCRSDTPEACAEILEEYAAAGVDLACIWPVVEPERQLERVHAGGRPARHAVTGRTTAWPHGPRVRREPRHSRRLTVRIGYTLMTEQSGPEASSCATRRTPRTRGSTSR